MMRSLLASFLSTAILSGCGAASSAEQWQARWGGPLDLYESVFREVDCAALEGAIVDEVDQMGRQLTDVDRRNRSAYIQAAFHHMVELNCAEAFQ